MNNRPRTPRLILSGSASVRWAGISLILAFLLLLGPLALAQTQSAAEIMQAGNQRYEAGEFDRAAKIYQSLVADGVENSVLYYNLGNAYFKQGDLGRAILNYRRAQRLAPRDAQIAANLAIARAQTLDRLEESESPLTNFIETAEEWLTLSEASILAVILWVFLCMTAIVAIVAPRLRRVSGWLMTGLGFFLAIGLVSMGSRFYRDYVTPPAVIVAQEVDVTSGPGSAEQYLVEFTLHSGAELLLVERRPGWRRIALSGNDFQGWVPDEAVEPVLVD